MYLTNGQEYCLYPRVSVHMAQFQFSTLHCALLQSHTSKRQLRILTVLYFYMTVERERLRMCYLYSVFVIIMTYTEPLTVISVAGHSRTAAEHGSQIL